MGWYCSNFSNVLPLVLDNVASHRLYCVFFYYVAQDYNSGVLSVFATSGERNDVGEMILSVLKNWVI